MISIITLSLAGVMWVGVLASVIRRPGESVPLRVATVAVLVLAVPIVAAIYVFYARG